MTTTHCMGTSWVLSGLDTVWPHHSALLEAEHISLTFTTMLFPNGPVDDGAVGSEVGVILKQRPQAPPGPLLAPYASWLTAAEYPFTFWPHAAGGRSCSAWALRGITMKNGGSGITYGQNN